MTPEQQRALALSRARRRRAEAEGQEPPAGTQVTAASDIVPSFAAGVARGTADLAGLPGTVGDMARGGLQWGLQKSYGLATGEAPDPYSESGLERFFAGPTPELEQSLVGGGRMPLSGDVMRSGLSAATGGATDYQPHTTAGKYARTVGEFLPGAMVLGGGGPANAIRYGAIPAVTSEGAGQLTEGTPWEPLARIGGALAGGVVGARVGQPTAVKPPTAAEIKQSAGYGQLDDAMRNARLTGDSYRTIVRDIWREANDFGLTTELKSKFGTTLTDFMRRAQASGGATLHDIELLRRSLRNAAGNTLDKSSQALSSRLVDALDDAVDALSTSHVASSSQTGRPVVEALKEGREIYRTGVKAQMVEDAVQKAQSAASGVENGLRNEFRKLATNPRLSRNFSAVERDAIRNVAEGNFTTNAMRWLGTFGVPVDQGRNFLGSLTGGGVGATIGGLIGGPTGATIGGFALPAVGTAAKIGSARATQGLADVAEALVKAGSQGQSTSSAAQAARQAVDRAAQLRALLQAQSAGQIPFARERVR